MKLLKKKISCYDEAFLYDEHLHKFCRYVNRSKLLRVDPDLESNYIPMSQIVMSSEEMDLSSLKSPLCIN